MPRVTWKFCSFLTPMEGQSLFDEAFIYIQSYMNVLNLKTVTAPPAQQMPKEGTRWRSRRRRKDGIGIEPTSSGLRFKLSVEAVKDHDISLKVLLTTQLAQITLR